MGIILVDTNRRIAGSQSFDSDTSTIDLGVEPRGQQVTGESTLVTLFLVRSQAADSSAHCLFGQSVAPSNPGLQYNVVRDGSGIYVFSGIVNSAYTKWAAAGSTNYGISLNKWTYVAAVNHGGTGYTFRHYRAIVGEEQSFLDISYNWGGQTGSLPSGFGAAVRIGNRTLAASTRLDGEIALTARWGRALSIEELDEVLDKGPLAVPRGMILFYAEGRDWGPFGVATVSNTSARAGAPPDRPRLVSRRVPIVSAAAASGVTINVAHAAIGVSTHAATISSGITVSAGHAAVGVDTHVANVSNGVVIPLAAAQVGVQTHQASISNGVVIPVNLAQVGISTYAFGLAAGTVIDVGHAALSVETHAAGVVSGETINVGLAQVGVSTHAAGVVSGVTVAVGHASIGLSTHQAGLIEGITVMVGRAQILLQTHPVILNGEEPVATARSHRLLQPGLLLNR